MAIRATTVSPEKTIPLTLKVSLNGVENDVARSWLIWLPELHPLPQEGSWIHWGSDWEMAPSTDASPMVATVRINRGARKNRRTIPSSASAPRTTARSKPSGTAMK